MTTLKRSGHTLVFVSHRLEEVFAITDRVTLMREGRTVAKSLATASLRQADLIRLMVGQEMKQVLPNRPDRSAGRSSRSPVLEVRNLSSLPAVRDISFKVHRGEILGLGGLVGAGRSETVEAYLAFVRDNAENSTLMENPMHLDTLRMPFALASDSSRRIAEFRGLSRIFRSVRICSWDIWLPRESLGSAILDESRSSMS